MSKAMTKLTTLTTAALIVALVVGGQASRPVPTQRLSVPGQGGGSVAVPSN